MSLVDQKYREPLLPQAKKQTNTQNTVVFFYSEKFYVFFCMYAPSTPPSSSFCTMGQQGDIVFRQGAQFRQYCIEHIRLRGLCVCVIKQNYWTNAVRATCLLLVKKWYFIVSFLLWINYELRLVLLIIDYGGKHILCVMGTSSCVTAEGKPDRDTIIVRFHSFC